MKKNLLKQYKNLKSNLKREEEEEEREKGVRGEILVVC